MNLTIREARPDDWRAIFELQFGYSDLSIDSYYSSFTNYASFKFALNEFYGDDDDDDRAVQFLAEVDSSLVGYLVGREHDDMPPTGPVAAAEFVYVEPGHQRKGIGRALMREFEGWGASRGCLETVIFSHPEFYSEFCSALGFVKTERCFRHISMLTAEQIAAGAASDDAPTAATETSDE